MKKSLLLLTLCVIIMAVGCSAPQAPIEPVAPENTVAPTEAAPEAKMLLASEGIKDGVMADIYGAKGEQFEQGNIPTRSLPLKIENIPEGTKSIAVMMMDPDGGNWVHWLAANIPFEGDSLILPENASIDLASSMVQGKNDFGTIGYGGPTPPSGTHNYVITVYALSDTLELEEKFTLGKFKKAIEGIVLSEAELTGSYAK